MSDMVQIGAWIYNPNNALFKGGSKRAALFQIFCSQPGSCDLLQKENTCLYGDAFRSCKFGCKKKTEGPTKASSAFHSTMGKWAKDNKDTINKLKPLTAYNRIFRVNGHYYLPYSHMVKSVWGGGYPLESQWIPESDMTTDTLNRICSATPYSEFGGAIPSYQTTEVPKFLADLKSFYPEIFALLPESQKARISTASYIGRKADLTTCAPGEYVIGNDKWRWDGEFLHGNKMLFAPAQGEVSITIKPVPGSPVTITGEWQVTDSTKFLD